ncbi:MAG: Rid family hydrolase [Marinifilum sp.]|jgi:enamine deaminase RidA (YjgF/YER057c/UK114 family)|nr:Rid family hydrolase [Marinifilum sp.]
MNISKVEGRQEYFINLSSDSQEALNRLLTDTVNELNIVPLNQFILGKTKEFCNEENELTIPSVWLTGNKNCSSGIISSQLTGIKSSLVQPIHQNGRLVGAAYEDEYAKYIRLAGVLPNDINASREKQTATLLENMNSILHQQGMSFKEVVRTWFYLDNILEWYDLFNVCRTHFFEEEKIFENLVPASTGIGSGNTFGAEIIGDLIAVVPKTSEVKISRADSPLQGSAMDYKSSFSRGIEINFPYHNLLYVSGTASINQQGETICIGNPSKQVQQTMEVVDKMLMAAKMNWNNVTRGIAYFKNHEYIEYFLKYCRENNIDISSISLFTADVCRDDLLFEIELDAIKSMKP